MSSPIKLRNPVQKDDHSQGPEDTALMIVQYGDYQCSYCAMAHPILKKLRQTFPKDLKFVFRHFPMTTIHPYAVIAAQAAEAAGLQGKFWEMHDTIYENQETLDPDNLIQDAESLGLDPLQFTNDMSSPAIEEKIDRDFYGGTRSGVDGTPSFFINGYRYDGDWSYPSLFRVLRLIQAQISQEGMKKAG